MNTDSGRLILEEETRAIIGAAMEVLNQIGHGYHEKPYENALVVEFELRGIPYEQQRSFPLVYKSKQIGVFIPDLLAFGSVVVDTKTVERITDFERGQMINYLRATGFKVGLILNFARSKLEWERIVL